ECGLERCDPPDSLASFPTKESLDLLDSCRAMLAIEGDGDSRDLLLLAIGRRIPCAYVTTEDVIPSPNLFFPELGNEIDARTNEAFTTSLKTFCSELQGDKAQDEQLLQIGQLIRSDDAKRI